MFDIRSIVQRICLLQILSFFGLMSFVSNAQDQIKAKEFNGFRTSNSNWTYLDSTHQKNLPSWRRESNGEKVQIVYALHKQGQELELFLDFQTKIDKADFQNLKAIQVKNEDSLFLVVKKADTNTVKLLIREPDLGFSELHLFLENQLLGTLEIDVISERNERVFLVPLFDIEVDEKLVENQINKIFRPFHLSFELELLPSFYFEGLEKSPWLDNPSPSFDHYTIQMRQIRDAYFKAFPNSNKQSYYVFIHKGFVNPSIQSYASKGKAVSFIKHQDSQILAYQMAVELARSIGGLDAEKSRNESVPNIENLMGAQGGVNLNPDQWRKLHFEFRGYPYFDEEEDINTNNGFVAYYFWKENEDGTIVFNPGAFRSAIERPYKKNYFSYHLDIEKRLFKPLFILDDFPISPINIILFIIYALAAFFLRRRYEKRLAKIVANRLKIRKIIGRLTLVTAVVVLTLVTFSTINKILAKYEIYNGVIPDFKGLKIDEVRDQILHNKDIRRSDVPEMSSEILVKRGEDWHVSRNKRVLYFNLYEDSLGIYSYARFITDSDSIELKSLGITKLAQSHYFVINRINQTGDLESQMLFNHQGHNVTNLLNFEKEPAKRILLFVNGYRPTSLGNTLESKFRDIRELGIEFPNSSNHIFNFDRYDYWRPWREIDLRFEKRINPSKTYYADGHFSVNTSNYRSLIHFTQVSSRYPTRCKDPNHHVCQNSGRTSWFRSSNDATYLLLPNRPNYNGFKQRRENGRIAGLNLLQELNEIPNSSHNDTIYIVAHSMGYAYALGMIDELRGKINFGGFYIIAPENGSVGEVKAHEWKEIWQYGVNHEKLKKSAPCMLDGVAPQTRIKGLDPKNHVFVPEDNYKRFGFFDSHFIGFFEWIFELDKGEKGAIEQR